MVEEQDRSRIEEGPSPSPAPLLRPPIPGGPSRSTGGARTPRLGLAIPPSPSQKPVSENNSVPELPPLVTTQRPSSRPTPPQLRLATPKGSNTTPHEGPSLANGRPSPQQHGGGSASGGSDGSGHSRSDSFTMVDGKTSNPTSASSSGFSHRHHVGTPDPASAISSVYSESGGAPMEREGSNHLIPDFEKLRLEKGRDLDIEDLDDDGWRAASEQKKIIELGSLGEGAGGAVTRCKLFGGKKEFALKVLVLITTWGTFTNDLQDYNRRSKSGREEADCQGTCFQQGLCLRVYLSILWSIHGRLEWDYFYCHGVLRGR